MGANHQVRKHSGAIPNAREWKLHWGLRKLKVAIGLQVQNAGAHAEETFSHSLVGLRCELLSCIESPEPFCMLTSVLNSPPIISLIVSLKGRCLVCIITGAFGSSEVSSIWAMVGATLCLVANNNHKEFARLGRCKLTEAVSLMVPA